MDTDKKSYFEKLNQDAIVSSIKSLGWGADFKLDPLHGGANNKVFRITAGQHEAVLKIYFQHPKDSRNRLAAEFGFSSFAWNNGVRSLPRPLVEDPNNSLAFYDYVPGRALDVEDVNVERVREAAAFFSEINRHRKTSESLELPLASEAFFSVEQHMACVSRRIDALGALRIETNVDRAAQLFVGDELIPAWQEVQVSLQNVISDAKPEDRCLSPSDFGFHNAILTSRDRLTFFDFEYAGWDDPAKTICDFFCQPKVPVSMNFYDAFANEIAACAASPEQVLARAQRLLPLYRIKWGCILLNEFLPLDEQRRQFAGVEQEQQQRKAEQLKKAQRVLAGLQNGGTKQ